MFTGIVQAVGQILKVQPHNHDVSLHIEAGSFDMSAVALGDSIATNGVCLTVTKITDKGFWADVSKETLDCTTVAFWQVGKKVNLEQALMPTSHLGGHIVSGHVDGVGEVNTLKVEGRSWRLGIVAPKGLAKYIAAKGSITVDGTSLTVNRVNGSWFELNIVPHTINETIIQYYREGNKVNLEVDIIARHLERLLLGDKAAEPDMPSSSITSDFLAEHGFLTPRKR
ncbi:riboflavin synthase [Zooshikella marina]|uniref:riboflavin synthase n=1 Tax=Zooshikella ganghwensis TaxID=202772 RepID=UPI001BAE6C61|nr:riboflavin synthase [Zooshikella ganghwensis]MBU2707449.1 riboflavin synthase [Zooshikella ganghwensis]